LLQIPAVPVAVASMQGCQCFSQACTIVRALVEPAAAAANAASTRREAPLATCAATGPWLAGRLLGGLAAGWGEGGRPGALARGKCACTARESKRPSCGQAAATQLVRCGRKKSTARLPRSVRYDTTRFVYLQQYACSAAVGVPPLLLSCVYIQHLPYRGSTIELRKHLCKGTVAQ
jgi:hypothetical protein